MDWSDSLWKQLDGHLYSDAMVAQLQYDMAMVNWLIASSAERSVAGGDGSQADPP